jgi:hypothetical protein
MNNPIVLVYAAFYFAFGLIVVYRLWLSVRDRSESRMGLLESRVSTLDGFRTGMASGLDGIQGTTAGRLDKVDQRIDRLEAQVSDLRFKVARLEGVDAVVNGKR